MFSRRFNVQICLLIVAASLFIVGCGVQRVMGVQGVLLDDNGDPLNGTFSMTFDYCTKASGRLRKFVHTNQRRCCDEWLV